MLVAVYGSLKRGYGNYHVMENAQGDFISEGVTKETFDMNGSGFPYIIKNPKGFPVKVEVFEVQDIQPLDWLEGNPTFYKREKQKILFEDGVEIEAWIYIYQGSIEANEELLENNIYTWKETFC